MRSLPMNAPSQAAQDKIKEIFEKFSELREIVQKDSSAPIDGIKFYVDFQLKGIDVVFVSPEPQEQKLPRGGKAEFDA